MDGDIIRPGRIDDRRPASATATVTATEVNDTARGSTSALKKSWYARLRSLADQKPAAGSIRSVAKGPEQTVAEQERLRQSITHFYVRDVLGR